MKKTIQFILSRSVIVFVVVYGVIALFINSKKVDVADKGKMSFYSHPSAYAPLVESYKDNKKLSDVSVDEYTYYFKNYLKMHPSALDAMYVLGYVYANKKESDKARTFYSKIVDRDDKNIWAQYNLAVVDLNNGRTRDAIRHLKTVISTGPERAMEFFKESEGVLVPIMHQAKLSPNDLRRQIKAIYRESYLGLILGCEKNKDFVGMYEMARLAIATNVGYKGDFLFYAAKAKYEQYDFDKAEVLFKEAIELRKDNVQAYRYLVETLKKLKKTDEATNYELELNRLSKMNIASPLEDQIKIRLY